MGGCKQFCSLIRVRKEKYFSEEKCLTNVIERASVYLDFINQPKQLISVQIYAEIFLKLFLYGKLILTNRSV